MRALHLAIALTAVTVLAAAPVDPGAVLGPPRAEPARASEAAARSEPRPRADLVLTEWACIRDGGEIALEGEVRNRGPRMLTGVIAVGVFQAETGALVKSDRALLAHSTLVPGQTSRFEVRAEDDPAIASCAIDFGHLFGGSLGFVEERETGDLAGLEPKQILALQLHLIDLGYDAGEPDGVIGPKTRDAILAYQQDHDLPPTGLVTAELLADLPEG